MMFLAITEWVIIFAMIAVLMRLLMRTTTWEKLMALNLLAVKLILLITVHAVRTNQPMLIDLSITYGIIGFLTVTLIAKFVYSRR